MLPTLPAAIDKIPPCHMNPIDCLSYINISKSWNRKPVLADINLKICRGQFSVLCGENGSGKTTLFKILSGLLRPDSGHVQGTKQPTPWKRARAMLLKHTLYMHQTPYMFSGSVYRNLSIATGNSADGSCRKQRIDEALDWIQLKRLSEESAHVLSGGQQQRVALARAWLKGSSFLFLDEPTANMDSQSVERTLNLLDNLKLSGCAIMICTHNPGIFADLADQMLMVADSGIRAAGFAAPSGEFRLNNPAPENAVV